MFYHEKISKRAAICGGVLALLLTGCSEEGAAQTPSSLSQSDLAGAAITTIAPGESAYITATDPASEIGKRLIALSPEMSDHIYPHAITDAKAPVITETPVRFRTQVVLHGSRSNYLDNDAACDTYNVPSSAESIGVVALGGSKDGVFVTWPTEEGKTVDQIEVCMFQESEPDDGIVMFAQ